MGLNHLREWIAPGYHHKNPAQDEARKLYNLISEEDSYRIIKELSNLSKHLVKHTESETSSDHDLVIGDWDVGIDSVKDFDRGPASAYTVDGKDVTELCAEVIQFYESNWFSRNNHS